MPVLPEHIATPLLAFCLAALVMPLLSRLAVQLGFVDHPSSRKIHSAPIPLLGGVGVYIGVIVTLLLRSSSDERVWLMMLASLAVIVLGVADDRLDLHSRYRLALQVLVAAGLSAVGVRFHIFPVVLLDHLVTIIWIVGVINAMNCLDCADGSAGGTCVVVFLALAILAAASGRYFVSQAALAGMGAVAGFLVYNVAPARVFLGDAGSTFLGLMAAVLAIMAIKTPVEPWQIPLAPFVLVVPVFDIFWVHYRRFQAGIRSVRELLSSTGKDHLPHRLMARGLSRRVCMLVVMFLSALAAISIYCLIQGLWTGALMSMFALAAFLWHLEERARVVIRAEDGVAIYELAPRLPALNPSSPPEESVA